LNLVLLESLKITLNIANSHLLHCSALAPGNTILHDTAARVHPGQAVKHKELSSSRADVRFAC
jgi:hypothetical protein